MIKFLAASASHNKLHVIIICLFDLSKRARAAARARAQHHSLIAKKSLNEEGSYSRSLPTSREEGRGRRRSKSAVPEAKRNCSTTCRLCKCQDLTG